jgi:hypothetical protein
MSTHEMPGPVHGDRRGDADAPRAREASRGPLVPAPVSGLTARHTEGTSQTPTGAVTETTLARLQRLADPARAGGTMVSAAGGPLDLSTSADIQGRLGAGAALPTDVRRRLEVGFGTRLGHVRVHEGAEADRLTTTLAARAFTVGNDVFLGRLARRAPDAEHVLAHEIAHVLTEPARLVRRWWQPQPPPKPQPLSTSPPRGKAQPNGILWDEVKQDPRGDVHRFVDGTGAGWEAPDAKKPWKRNDWHLAAAKAEAEKATWWYDLTAAKWLKGKTPDTHRQALAEERVDLTGTDLKGYPGTNAVPMYVKAKYRLTKASKKTKGGRGPGLRALDRTARLLMTDIPAESTPHLATGTAGGLPARRGQHREAVRVRRAAYGGRPEPRHGTRPDGAPDGQAKPVQERRDKAARTAERRLPGPPCSRRSGAPHRLGRTHPPTAVGQRRRLLRKRRAR